MPLLTAGSAEATDLDRVLDPLGDQDETGGMGQPDHRPDERGLAVAAAYSGSQSG